MTLIGRRYASILCVRLRVPLVIPEPAEEMYLVRSRIQYTTSSRTHMECPTCGRSVRTRSGVRQHHTKVHGESLPNRTCSSCGTEFYDPKSQRKYCDDCNPNAGENNGNWKGGTETTKCKICGKGFEYYPPNKRGVYCQECVEQADGLLPENPSTPANVTAACEQCDRTIRVHEWRKNRNSCGVFCSVNCYGRWLSSNVVGKNHHQWNGGSFAYGTGWWQTRREALRRDDYQCKRCGATAEEIGQNPDVHHITPVREFENPEDAHTLSNVVCLCRSCHRTVESTAGRATRFEG